MIFAKEASHHRVSLAKGRVVVLTEGPIDHGGTLSWLSIVGQRVVVVAVEVIDIGMQEGFVDDSDVIFALRRVVGPWRIFKVVVPNAASPSNLLPEVEADDCQLLEDVVDELINVGCSVAISYSEAFEVIRIIGLVHDLLHVPLVNLP
jgi:hypothetical protein